MSEEIDSFQVPFLELSRLECSDVSALTSCYVDGEMLEALKQKFEGHIRTCSICRELVAQTEFVVESASQIRDREIPTRVQLKLRETLKEQVGFDSPKLQTLRES